MSNLKHIEIYKSIPFGEDCWLLQLSSIKNSCLEEHKCKYLSASGANGLGPGEESYTNYKCTLLGKFLRHYSIDRHISIIYKICGIKL